MPIAEGYYKDNKRVGQWTYYVGFYNDPNAHLKQVTFTDSGYYFEIDSFWHFRTKVSNDTNNLTGTLFLKDDTLQVVCKNKICVLKDPFNKNKEDKFPLKDLESKLTWLNFRSYHMKMKKNGK